MYAVLAFPAIVATIAVLSFWTPGTSSNRRGDRRRRDPHHLSRYQGGDPVGGHKEFVVAAKMQGASDRRILLRELLPNIAPILISFLMIGIATVVTLEGALAFLGLSVNPPTPSWGNMINEAAP